MISVTTPDIPENTSPFLGDLIPFSSRGDYPHAVQNFLFPQNALFREDVTVQRDLDNGCSLLVLSPKTIKYEDASSSLEVGRGANSIMHASYKLFLGSNELPVNLSVNDDDAGLGIHGSLTGTLSLPHFSDDLKGMNGKFSDITVLIGARILKEREGDDEGNMAVVSMDLYGDLPNGYDARNLGKEVLQQVNQTNTSLALLSSQV